MFDWVTDPEIWIGFFTLVALEIVLGIDNIIFISILAGQAAAASSATARRELGLVARPGHPRSLLLLVAVVDGEADRAAVRRSSGTGSPGAT